MIYLYIYLIGFVICAPVFGYWSLRSKDIYYITQGNINFDFIMLSLGGVILALFWPMGIFPLMVWILTKIFKSAYNYMKDHPKNTDPCKCWLIEETGIYPQVDGDYFCDHGCKVEDIAEKMKNQGRDTNQKIKTHNRGCNIHCFNGEACVVNHFCDCELSNQTNKTEGWEKEFDEYFKEFIETPLVDYSYSE